MLRSSNFEKLLDTATSHLRLDIDWPSTIKICDMIRQGDIPPKNAVASIKKKMQASNPHTAEYACCVLESIMKNCGSPVHDEIATTSNCEFFSTLINQTKHDNVRAKMLELIQTWTFAFRTQHKYQAVKDTMNILKSEGHKFPELKESDAMFDSDTAPEWIDGDVCHRCRSGFSITNRRHHCRNCGQVFCGKCSSKVSTIPKYGIEKDVRVCDACFNQLQKPPSAQRPAAKSTESDLPAEYLTSSLAQQNQVPPRKTEQELQEEEELQLALALSQSEAESKKSKSAYVPKAYQIQRAPSPEVTKPKSPSPVEETNDPELARYLNRSYWENRKTTDSPASPSAPSPMQSTASSETMLTAPSSGKLIPEDIEIDEFATAMKGQLEIFVNRMKSNSSRGRSISTDSSVQTLFMTITSLHSKLLNYTKDMDDKRLWYEQLQDKLNQIKDSRAALDLLRQEHQDKLRRQAEEAERLRQFQMAQKLEVMRKKKHEYLQYQRQIALQRIQEQEREMQLRQEQQKAQYRIGSQPFPFMGPSGIPQQIIQMPGGMYGYQGGPQMQQQQRFGGQPMYGQMPGMQGMPPGMQMQHPGQLPAQQNGAPPQQGGMNMPQQMAGMPQPQHQMQGGFQPQPGLPPQGVAMIQQPGPPPGPPIPMQQQQPVAPGHPMQQPGGLSGHLMMQQAGQHPGQPQQQSPVPAQSVQQAMGGMSLQDPQYTRPQMMQPGPNPQAHMMPPQQPQMNSGSEQQNQQQQQAQSAQPPPMSSAPPPQQVQPPAPAVPAPAPQPETPAVVAAPPPAHVVTAELISFD